MLTQIALTLQHLMNGTGCNTTCRADVARRSGTVNSAIRGSRIPDAKGNIKELKLPREHVRAIEDFTHKLVRGTLH